MEKTFTILSLLVLLALNAYSDDSGRRLDNVAWMKVGIGARAQALAGAFTARADDGSATYWNPAFIESFGPYDAEITAMGLPLSDDRRCAFINYIQNFGSKKGSVGVSWSYYRIGMIENRDEDGTRLGTSEDLENAFVFSYGLALNPDWKVGASLKYYLHQLDNEKGQGIGVDLGTFFKPKGEWLRWELGATLKDLSPGMTWSTGRRETIAPTLRLGLAYHLIYDQLIASLDADASLQEKAVLHGGVEWWVLETVAARAGLDANGIYAGAGYRFGPCQIDYSFSAFFEGLADEHRITVMYKI